MEAMLTENPNRTQYDVVIVGGSTAGLAAAMSLGRTRRCVLLVDAGEPRNHMVDRVHNLLGHDGQRPQDWLTSARSNLENLYEATVESYAGVVDSIQPRTRTAPEDDYMFDVTITKNKRSYHVQARRIVLATGIKDNLEGYPDGVQDLWGDKIQHCPFCAGYERVGSAWGYIMHPALMFPKIYAPLLMPFNKDQKFFVFTNGLTITDRDRAEYAANGMTVVDDKISRVEECKAGVIVHLESGKSETMSIVYARPPFIHSPLVKQLGVAIHPMMGSVVVDPMWGATNVDGVFAAGDVSEPRQKLSFAMAQGTAAGMGAYISLCHKEWAMNNTKAGLPAPSTIPAPQPQSQPQPATK